MNSAWVNVSPGVAYSHVVKTAKPEVYLGNDVLIDSYSQHQQVYAPPQYHATSSQQQQEFGQQQATLQHSTHQQAARNPNLPPGFSTQQLSSYQSASRNSGHPPNPHLQQLSDNNTPTKPREQTYRIQPIGTGRLTTIYPSPEDTPRASSHALQESVGRQLFDMNTPSLSIRDSRVRELEAEIERLEADKKQLKDALGSFL